MTPRQAAEVIWRAGLAAVEPEAAVRRHFRAVAPGVLGAGRHEIGLGGRLWVVGAGKGAAAMARGVGAVAELAGGLVVSSVPGDAPVPLVASSHPLPSVASDDAARAIAEVVRAVPPTDVICAVWSGGGSAALAGPHPGTSLSALIDVSTTLLRSGLSIREVNTVRRRIYRLAGGRLRALARAPVFNLGLLDVPADALAEATLASGPMVADPTSRDDAAEILARLGVSADLAPDAPVGRGPSVRVGGVDDVVHAATHAARGLGYVPLVVSASEDRPADEVVSRVCDAIRAVAGGPPMALIVAGEARVTVSGRGRGGRCQHAAARLAGVLATENLAATALIAGLDGVDGGTPAAGGLVDTGTVERAGSAPDAALAAGDSHAWLSLGGDAFSTGPSGTACCDLWVVLVGAPVEA